MIAKKPWVLMGIAVLLVMSVSARPAEAKHGFSNASLSGSYSGTGTSLEWFTTPPPFPTSFKLDVEITTLTTYDGAGNCSGSITQSQAFTFPTAPTPQPSLEICTGTFTCTYTVNADGTGTTNATVSFNSGPCISSTVTTSFVLGNGGALVNSVITSVTIPAADGTVTSLVGRETETQQ